MKPQYILTALGSSPQLGHPDRPARSLFTFGDSYTTTGFNVTSTQPSLDNPMGNPPLGQGTASDSINWVGYAATAFNHTPLLSYNFAVWDATVNNSLAPGAHEDLVAQVSAGFEPLYCLSSSVHPASDPVWESDLAVFVLWFGINDVLQLYQDPDFLHKIRLVIDSYLDQLTKLEACGARFIFLINAPPTHRTPKFLAGEKRKREEYRQGLTEFNLQLETAASRWASEHVESTLALYDSWTFMTGVLDHPAEYEFPDITCIGEGCIWWDDFHPRSAFHRILAQDIADRVHIAFAGGV
ncbi:hypothetical protein ASPCAL00934 [Aspergillus calidoustus]|uniref:Carbohydrate esterase family 16 protein n=1 Tax=Aspergillus calidoustus TaxID=454130 RepID=A0A0U4YWH5_ASPCI|nr:hypothetical protein ASPCAL00934 [Aspergillus calidoustus]